MGTRELVRSARRAALSRLDDEGLARFVTGLGPEGMAAWVEAIGLEDAAGELALATPAQVLEVLDRELWQSGRVGETERLDRRRFAAWVEAMVEVGPHVAAQQLAEAPIELVVAGVFQQALVFDADELWLSVARGLMDPAVEDLPRLDLAGYLVAGRGHDGWDALSAALDALEDAHPEVCGAVLDRCRELTDRAIGETSLSEALEDEDAGEEEAALEREDRRARRGFVAPHAARAFLAFAVEVDLAAQLAFGGRDPITAAYFRDWERPDAGASERGLSRGGLAGARAEELGYLVQVVLGACTTRGRAFTVEEAAEAVLAVGRVGEQVAGARGTADTLFRCGFHLLHHRVVRPARARRDRSGLAEAIPRLDGRFVGSLAELERAEAAVR